MTRFFQKNVPTNYERMVWQALISPASEKALLMLLKCELFQLPLSTIASADWPLIFAEANRHAVTALFWPVMKRQPEAFTDILPQVRRTALFSASASEALLRSQREIIAMLEESRIPCAILKGASVARCYPHPELRIPGDIDLLVGEANLQAACDAFTAAGYTYSHTTELHTCFHKGRVEVEVHSAVSYFPEGGKGAFAKQYMGDALQHVDMVQIKDVSFPVLTGAYQLIALLSHMERHLESSGIGLRQMCDWAVTVHAQRDHIGDAELAVLDQCGLLQFAKVSTKACVKYLGLPIMPWCADADDDLCDTLMSDILDAGNFQAQKMRYLSNVLTDTSFEDDDKKPSTLRNYLHYIRKRTQKDHPWAKSSLWVVLFGIYYPIRWVVRMLSEKSKRKYIAKAVQSAKTREKLMWRLKVYK